MDKQEKIILHAQRRNELGKNSARRFRRNGLIPAILYGHSMKNENIVIPYGEWRRLEGKELSLLELKIDNEQPVTVLVKDIQVSYLKTQTLHIDFFRVKMDEEITVAVPIHAIGTAKGTSHGGMLEQVLHEIEISCLPADLPEHIDVDVSDLDIEDVIHVEDLQLGDKIKCNASPDQIVFHVVKEAVAEVEEEVGEEGEKTEEEKKESESEQQQE